MVQKKFWGVLTPVTITALLVTLVLLFSFKGDVITANPLTIVWIAIPLFIQTIFIFALGYGCARMLKLRYEDAALATMVCVLIEVPVMLLLVGFCKRTAHWFADSRESGR